MTNIHFSYKFHAVGQGLFATGSLREIEHDQKFNWVFDCGTLSKRAFIQREVNQFRQSINNEQIELFCLSHFDKDHINGARELLSNQRVDFLVMPYYPLVERIQIAFGTNDLSDEYLRFLINPAGFMYDAAGENLGTIIFITGGGEQFEAESEEPTEPAAPEISDLHWKLHLPDSKKGQPANEDIYGSSDVPMGKNVLIFGDQKPFKVGGAWEFLFYNEHIPDSRSDALLSIVAPVVRRHKNANGSFNGLELLKELKPIYRDMFGSSGLAQNAISLVMYSGPVEQSSIQNFKVLCGGLSPVNVEVPSMLEVDCFIRWHKVLNHSKVSIGYFGDFPLNPSNKIRDVRNHFGQLRWDHLQVIQVPHHGSKLSWYPGASAEFTNRISVISSARNSKKHPSQSVLDDLSTHGILLVNEMQRADFIGNVVFQ